MDMDELKRLAVALASAVEAEAAAKQARTAAEQAVYTALMFAQLPLPEEGTKTLKPVEGLKITVNQPINRKLDEARYHEMTDGYDIPPELNPVRMKLTVHDSTAKKLRDDPEAWGFWSQCITETPGKASVKVEVS